MPSEKTAYSMGFLFSLAGDKVVLIRKNRPAQFAGKLMGVGGHVEQGETHIHAMRREFLEETGYAIADWTCFGMLEGDDYVIHLFRAYDCTDNCRTTTDEEIVICPLPLPTHHRYDPDVRWILEMAQHTQGCIYSVHRAA